MIDQILTHSRSCCRSRCMKCILFLTVIVSVVVFLFYPRPIKFSFPTDEWLDILLEEADNGQGIIWDSTDSSFVVDCEVPVGVKNENFFVPLNVDIEAEVFYPSSLDSGEDGVKIATTEKEVKVAANSEEEVLLPAQAHVIPSGADGVRMATEIGEDCHRTYFLTTLITALAMFLTCCFTPRQLETAGGAPSPPSERTVAPRTLRCM